MRGAVGGLPARGFPRFPRDCGVFGRRFSDLCLNSVPAERAQPERCDRIRSQARSPTAETSRSAASGRARRANIRSPSAPGVGACRSGQWCRPLLILAVGFHEGAPFEGRIAEQIDQLEQAGTIRVLDFVFLHRDEATGALVRMDYDGPDWDGEVTTLLQGAQGNGGRSADAVTDAYRLSPSDIRDVADALDPGTSAGFIIFEHLWARGLKEAILETDGVPFAEGFLTPEAVAALGG